eukprot:COSAG06_NODE_24036_length_674_cov_2.093913_2_plen_124_part_00
MCVDVSASVRETSPDGPKLTYSPRAVTASKQADDIDEDAITLLSRRCVSACVLCHQSAVLSAHLHQSALSLRLASLLAALLMSVHAPGGHSCSACSGEDVTMETLRGDFIELDRIASKLQKDL